MSLLQCEKCVCVCEKKNCAEHSHGFLNTLTSLGLDAHGWMLPFIPSKWTMLRISSSLLTSLASLLICKASFVYGEFNQTRTCVRKPTDWGFLCCLHRRINTAKRIALLYHFGYLGSFCSSDPYVNYWRVMQLGRIASKPHLVIRASFSTPVLSRASCHHPLRLLWHNRYMTLRSVCVIAH